MYASTSNPSIRPGECVATLIIQYKGPRAAALQSVYLGERPGSHLDAACRSDLRRLGFASTLLSSTNDGSFMLEFVQKGTQTKIVWDLRKGSTDYYELRHAIGAANTMKGVMDECSISFLKYNEDNRPVSVELLSSEAHRTQRPSGPTAASKPSIPATRLATHPPKPSLNVDTSRTPSFSSSTSAARQRVVSAPEGSSHPVSKAAPIASTSASDALGSRTSSYSQYTTDPRKRPPVTGTSAGSHSANADVSRLDPRIAQSQGTATTQLTSRSSVAQGKAIPVPEPSTSTVSQASPITTQYTPPVASAQARVSTYGRVQQATNDSVNRPPSGPSAMRSMDASAPRVSTSASAPRSQQETPLVSPSLSASSFSSFSSSSTQPSSAPAAQRVSSDSGHTPTTAHPSFLPPKPTSVLAAEPKPQVLRAEIMASPTEGSAISGLTVHPHPSWSQAGGSAQMTSPVDMTIPPYDAVKHSRFQAILKQRQAAEAASDASTASTSSPTAASATTTTLPAESNTIKAPGSDPSLQADLKRKREEDTRAHGNPAFPPPKLPRTVSSTSVKSTAASSSTATSGSRSVAEKQTADSLRSLLVDETKQRIEAQEKLYRLQHEFKNLREEFRKEREKTAELSIAEEAFAATMASNARLLHDIQKERERHSATMSERDKHQEALTKMRDDVQAAALARDRMADLAAKRLKEHGEDLARMSSATKASTASLQAEIDELKQSFSREQTSHQTTKELLKQEGERSLSLQDQLTLEREARRKAEEQLAYEKDAKMIYQQDATDARTDIERLKEAHRREIWDTIEEKEEAVAALEREGDRTLALERALADFRREAAGPFVVPSLMEAFGMIANITTDAMQQ